jgi:iron complex outermembrane receptor protein
MGWMLARRPYTLCVVLCFAETALASVQGITVASLADLSLEELSDIEIVSVSRRPQPLSEAPAAIYVITADDIRRSGATSLPDALRLAPNLQVAEINSGRMAISARGFNGPEASKLLVLVDGRSVYTPLFAGVFWDAQDVLLQDVARIEVISGPGGTLWGVNAVNGVINIITRTAQETQGDLLVLGGGTAGADAGARHGGTLGNGGAFRIHARHFYRHRTELETSQKVQDAWRMSQAGFRADWARAQDTMSVNGQIQYGVQEQAAPGTFSIRGVPLELLPVHSRGANLLGHWGRKLNDDAKISVQAYVDHTERVVPISFDQKLTIGDVQLQYEHQLTASQTWVLGGEYRVAQDKVGNSNFIGFMPQTTTQKWLSLFAQDDLHLRPNLTLILGLRAESNDYTGVEWLPNARLSWKPSSNHLLWTAMSRTVRAPSRIDRDAFIPWPSVLGPGPTYLLAGGPEVKSEIAKVFELGYRGQPLPGTSLSVNLFRALYDNLHTQESGGSSGYLVFAGRMRGAVSGIEGWGSWQPTPAWRLSAGFTAFYQRFNLKPGSTDVEENLAKAQDRDPAQTWQWRSAWDLPAQQEIDVTLRHVSAVRGERITATFTDQVPSYLAADVRWGWHARPGLELSVTGRNLLGRGHAEYLSANVRTFLRPSVHLQAVTQF